MRQTYHIGNMDCAHCAKEVETGVARLDGVDFVRVDFASGKMHLEGEVDFNTLKNRVESLGKTITTETDTHHLSAKTRGGILGFWDYLAGRFETRLALLGAALTLVTLIFNLPYASLLYTVAMLIALYPIAKSGINTLRINREFSINLLMSIAAIGAIIMGEYLEAFTVIFLFAIGESLEGYTADRARDSLRSLIALKPTQALLLSGDNEQVVSVESLRINDIILVKPGESIPMDGEILSGSSSVNQSPITGESIPVYKTTTDTVYAGSINGEGTLKIRVTHLAKDNTLNRIIQLVEEAQSNRAHTQRIIDQFAHYYTPGVVIIALLVALIPPFLFDGTVETWAYRALTILVIACPCALVISAPVTVISAITAAARRGILIKGGVHLEALGKIRAIAFDKTGTLTKGKPVVVSTKSVSCTGEAACPPCNELVKLAASVEHHSTHPLAQAVVDHAQAQNLSYVPAQNVTALAGQGVRGIVAGQPVMIGSHTLFDTKFPHPKELCEEITAKEAQGLTTMLVGDSNGVRGYITVADEPRAESPEVIQQLNALGITTVMLTGDNPAVAQSIAQRLGVQTFQANLLPEQKVNGIETLKSHHQHVAMVG
ncbi:MAG: cadmium-translocating P-type ATPase, partial [Chloroflexi bacterium]